MNSSASPSASLHLIKPQTLAWRGLWATVATAVIVGCASDGPKIKGLPSNLPNIALYDSTHTPNHSMGHADYPFAPGGDYVTAWAAEGGISEAPSRGSGSHHSDGRPSSRSSSKGKVSYVRSKSKSSKAKSSGRRTHIVKSSDSLYSLAKKYGTSVAKLKSANGMKSDTIVDGKRLVIP